ncbi:MAG: class I SAM-dependent methyltransferase [Thermosipho sp. (in: Bacteria)]|nr:class I SAM-dependent methyltransferase [Thermosipho sp. (in: thermotogales)]
MKAYEYYDKIAHIYDQMYQDKFWITFRKAIKRYIENAIKAGNYKTVLDVGAGTGYWIDYFLSKNLEVTAVEPSEKMVEILKQKFGNNVRIYNSKIEDFQISKKFDIVNIQGDVLSYVEDLDRAMKAIKSVIRKDGILFATVDSYYYMKKLIQKDGTQRELDYFEKYHITTVGSQYGVFKSRCLTIEDILGLEKYGFKVLDIRGCGFSENLDEEIKQSKLNVKKAEHLYFSLLSL